MAIITVETIEEFIDALRSLTNPSTHVIVTDMVSTIVAVPRTTSRHRHYIRYFGDEDDIKTLVSEIKDEYEIIHGRVQIGSC